MITTISGILFLSEPFPIERFVRYDNLPSFEKHLKEASTSRFSPIYFILGKEAFECNEAIRILLQNILPDQKMREFGLTVFDGAQLEELELTNALYTDSFFVKTRVINIQQSEKLNKPLQEILESYMNRPSPSLFLILNAAAWQKNSLFYKAVDKIGVILEFAELKPWEKEKKLAEWVSKQVASLRKLISYPVAQFIVKRVGNDQMILAQELEKLVCYCSEKNEITKQDVEAICSSLHVETIWQLGEAIFSRNSSAALEIGHSLLRDGQPLLPLLRQIRSQFQTEYQICLLLAQGKQKEDISKEFPYMKGQILERHLQQALSYGLKAFTEGFLALETAEMRTKNSSISDPLVLELLLMQVTR